MNVHSKYNANAGPGAVVRGINLGVERICVGSL